MSRASCLFAFALIASACSPESARQDPTERVADSAAPSITARERGPVSSTDADGRGALSGSGPLPAAPSSARSAAPIVKELQALEMGDGSGPGSAPGAVPHLLEDDDAQRILIQALADGAATRLAGRPAREATIEDVATALGQAGCVTTRLDSPAQGAPTHAVFDAKCGGKSFVITFVPSTGKMLSDAVIAELERSGEVLHEGGVLLSVKPVAPADRAAAKALLDQLVARAPAAGIADAPIAAGGSIANTPAVVAGMRAGFRRCYAQGLKEDASIEGSLTVEASVGANGEVTASKVTRMKGLSATVASCIEGVVSSRRFDPPEGGGATVAIPVTFAAPR